MTAPVLHAVVTGAPPAGDVGRLVALAGADGWGTHLVASPSARPFLDLPRLAAATGHPVRTDYRQPGDPWPLPPPTAVVLAPATGNTLAKWAAGISDTLALGLLVEAVGQGTPVVAAPFSNTAHLAHPAVAEAITRLRSWGVTVLTGPEVCPPHPPGPAAAHAERFGWDAVWAAVTGHPHLAGARAAAPAPDPIPQEQPA